MRDEEGRPRGRIWRTCAVCGTKIPLGAGNRCPAHPKRWAGGGRRDWRKQRERILERDGYRCTGILDDGTRCRMSAPYPLEVHHLYSGSDIAAPDEHLVTVCRRHNPRGGIRGL